MRRKKEAEGGEERMGQNRKRTGGAEGDGGKIGPRRRGGGKGKGTELFLAEDHGI